MPNMLLPAELAFCLLLLLLLDCSALHRCQHNKGNLKLEGC